MARTGLETRESSKEEIKVYVRLIPDETPKIVKISKGTKVIKLLESLGLNPEEVVVIKDKTPITEDEIISEEMHLEIVRVTSGG